MTDLTGLDALEARAAALPPMTPAELAALEQAPTPRLDRATLQGINRDLVRARGARRRAGAAPAPPLAAPPVPPPAAVLVAEALAAQAAARERLRTAIATVTPAVRPLLDAPGLREREWAVAALGGACATGDQRAAGAILTALFVCEDAREAVAVAEASADHRLCICKEAPR